MFSVAELANFNRDEQRAYQDSLKYYRDLENAMDTIYEKRREEGKQEERLAIARQMKREGFTTAQITLLTGLSDREITEL